MIVAAAVLALLWLALSAAAVLRRSPIVTASDPPEVVVVDARGVIGRAETIQRAIDRAHVHPDAVALAIVGDDETVPGGVLDAAAACFDDPRIGAVQPAIRSARADRLLERLQDLEWVGLTELHTSRGQAFGALGTGPAAPVYRLSALRELWRWPDGPSDDVRVAAELAHRGWRLVCCRRSIVRREPAPDLRSLLRARIAAAEGLWRAVPTALRLLPRSPASATALLAPVALVLVGVVLAAGLVAVAADPGVVRRVAGGWRLPVWYLALFGPAWIAGFAYWARHDAIGFGRAILLGHVFVPYSLHWVVAASVALLRLPFRRGHRERPAAAVG